MGMVRIAMLPMFHSMHHRGVPTIDHRHRSTATVAIIAIVSCFPGIYL
jgi:hypothetical protein